MRVSIDHPTDRPNFTKVELGEVTIWFSYRTPVGFGAPGHGRVVRENDWGPTTGKHLNYIDNGRKSERVVGDVFTAKLASVLAPMGLEVTA